ncbi:pentapeptide repeat-containing protein [Glycomyces harbinensis]|uniref:Pentapeptide repeat-containing protein n=1 Tax=Glycomyces harbinensis TaxID=58114 RepID=A0A1G6Y803_9ACTN|nr:hypothetical protein [Glycomyces harbinensis]SDD85706.1 hypothetical protein SAMN05216270_108150 [Glycomyces harbinensis]
MHPLKSRLGAARQRVAPKLRFIASGDDGRWLPLRLWFHIALFFGLAVASMFVLLAIFQGVFSPSLKDELKVEVIRLSLFIIAGIGGVFALVISYRRQGLNEAAEVRVEQAEAREDGKVFNERFKSAAEQLSSEQAANRLAGVYAMAGLADDWDKGRQTCISVLCAYLRMPYEPPDESATADTAEATPVEPEVQKARRQERQVRHTIINVIRERLRSEPVRGKTWHGHDFDFTEAHFDGGDLSGIMVTGGVMRFRNAVFTAAGFAFANARFSRGTVDFYGARFSNAWLDFSEAQFVGSRVLFMDATFAVDWLRFENTTFTAGEVDFTGARFEQGLLDFNWAVFSGGGINFMWATFSGTRVLFTGAAFTGGAVDFTAANGWETLAGFVPPQGPVASDGLHLPRSETAPEHPSAPRTESNGEEEAEEET